MSEVLFEIEDYRSAAEISEEAFRVADGTELAGWFRIQAAEAHKILGNFRRAEQLARQAIRLNKHIGDPFDIAGAYNISGLIQAEKTKPDLGRAKSALRKAIAVIETIDLNKRSPHRREGIRNFHARALNNLGLALFHTGEIGVAITIYKKSLKIKRSLGDLLGVAITSGNISIAHLRDGNVRLSSRWRAPALELMNKYELAFQKPTSCARRAYLFGNAGMFEQGANTFARRFLSIRR